MKNRRKRTYSEGDPPTIGEVIGGLAIAAFLPCLILTGVNVITISIGIIALIEMCILIYDFWPVLKVMAKIIGIILLALLVLLFLAYLLSYIV